MDLDELKAQLDRLLSARSVRPTREQTSGLREALVSFKVGIGEMRDALGRTERELDVARREATDYERRGRLAQEIDDAETTRIAEEYTAKARERVDLLERKVLVQRDELAMAQREYDTTMARYQAASRGIPEGATAADPLTEGMPPVDEALLDQRAREAAVDAQLAMLKKKLGDRT